MIGIWMPTLNAPLENFTAGVFPEAPDTGTMTRPGSAHTFRFGSNAPPGSCGNWFRNCSYVEIWISTRLGLVTSTPVAG